jgi:hypothetical protein
MAATLYIQWLFAPDLASLDKLEAARLVLGGADC